MNDATPFVLDLEAVNAMPSRYRQVAVADVPVDVRDDELAAYFVGREAYMRTVFIVVRRGDRTALVEVAREPADTLFSTIESARVVALPDDCRWLSSPETDVGVPSHLAAVALPHVATRCVVVEGRYGHVSFPLKPRPLVVEVIDIVPPFPSKLLDQAQRVLDTGERLAPIVLRDAVVDSRQLLADAQSASTATALLPCRVTGEAFEPLDVAFLDQRPPRRNWTLLGCERSQDIHRWFYGESAPMVDTCPRRCLSEGERGDARAVLTRCCMRQEGVEVHGRTAVVPWGSNLDEVEAALAELAGSAGVSWTLI